jgi:putative membrane protein
LSGFPDKVILKGIGHSDAFFFDGCHVAAEKYGGAMKRVFYIVLTLLVFFIGITFAFQNKQSVDLNYYLGFHWNAPLSLVLVLTLAIGVGVGYLVSLRMVVRARRELAQARREVKQVEQEVENLRSLPIKDVI